jgi:hypothetical protein
MTAIGEGSNQLRCHVPSNKRINADAGRIGVFGTGIGPRYLRR